MKGRGYAPQPGNNGKNARVATSGLKADVAKRIYDDVATKVKAEFEQRQAALDAKGVFDSSVNALRAETQMQVAIDSRYRRALAEAAGDEVNATASTRIPAPRPLRESPVPRKSRSRRAQGAAAKQRSQSVLALAGVGNAAGMDAAAKNASLAEQLERLQTEVSTTGHVTAVRPSSAAPTTATSKQGPDVVAGGGPYSASGGVLPPAAVRRSAKVVDASPDPRRATSNRDADGPQQQPDDHDDTDDTGNQQVLPAATTNGSGVASFLQQTLEHSEYQDLEAEERLLAKKRDNALREPDPVDRYTTPWLAKHPQQKAWASSAATLTAEEMISGRAEGVSSPPAGNGSPAIARSSSPGGGGRATSPPANETGRHVERLERTDVARENRLRHRLDLGRQLASQHALMHPSLHFQSELGGGVLSPNPDVYTSSDDDDDVLLHHTNDGSAGGGGSRLFGGQEAEGSAQERRAQEACDLVECTVVCLAELSAATALGGGGGTAKPLGPAPIQRDRHILRNVLMNGLNDLMFVVRDELKRRKRNRSAQMNEQAGGQQEQHRHRGGPAAAPSGVKEAPPYAYRVLRSWAKGLEVLLAMDLSLPPGMPFSTRNEAHIEGMVRHYCAMRLSAERHADALMAQWKRQADMHHGVSSVTGQPPSPGAQEPAEEEEAEATDAAAADVMRALQSTASVPLSHIAKLSAAEAKLRFQQREVAGAFLDRFKDVLPPPQGRKGGSPSPTRRDATPPRDSATDVTAAASPAQASSSSAARLKSILLRYAGLRDPSAASQGTTASERSGQLGASAMMSSAPTANVSATSGAFGAGSPSRDDEATRAMTSRSLTSFLAVFKGTWGRTPLDGAVGASEREQRHKAIEAGLIEQLIGLYWKLLSEREQIQLKHRVVAEQNRIASIEARQAAQDAAFRRATGAKSAESIRHEIAEAQGSAALHSVHRQQLADRHRAKPDGAALAHLQQLRKAIERTDEWFGHEADKRAMQKERDAARAGSSSAAGLTSPSARPAKAGDGEGLSSELAGSEEGLSVSAGAGGGSRMEALRLRRLRELELAWQELQIGYAQRMLLHEKWNAADLKQVDRAARLYDECARSVMEREASVEEISSLEAPSTNSANGTSDGKGGGSGGAMDDRQRTVRRHQAFSEMCAAGQRCEVAAKRLRAETGDTLYFRDVVYLDKLKDDFTAVSKLLRASGAVGGGKRGPPPAA